MRIFILISILFLAYSGNSQTVDTSLYRDLGQLKIQLMKSGKEMHKYAKLQYTGIGVQMLGAAVIGLAAMSDKPDNKGFYYAGGGLITAGFVVTLFSHQKIKRAGDFFIEAGSLNLKNYVNR